MKKILFVIDTLEVGGAEQSILEIVSRFKRYTPVVCFLYHGESLRKNYEQRGIHVIAAETPGHYNFSEAERRLQVIAEKERPALIHSTLFRSDRVSRSVAKRLGIPLINSLVNDSYSGSRYSKLSFVGKLKLKVVEYMDRFTAGSVNHFISNSEAINGSNAEKLKVSPTKITVIYRGRDSGLFNQPAASSIKQELNLPQSTKVMINVSRLLERKGQLDLLRAFALITKDYADLVLIIVGDGPFRTVLEEEIKKLQLGAKVFLIGTRDDVPSLLSQSEVFVFPSHYEGLPGALIEAMMSRLKIVASAIPENMECVSSRSAWLYEKGNVQALSEAMRKALDDQTSDKGNVASMEAAVKFDINSIATQYENFYDSILQQ